METFLLVSHATHWIGKFFVPSMILLIAIAFLVVIRVMASRYKKIAPNKTAIVYGRKYKILDAQGKEIGTRGFRVVAGGGFLLWPIIENMQEMSTAVDQTTIDEHEIPNKDNVKVSAKGVGTFKIETTEEALYNAAAAFLGKPDEEIAGIVKNILQGHLRSIIGKLDIDEILRKRDTFNQQVVEESTEELKRLGVQIITLVITEVTDEYGYIDALGKKTVAEAIRDAKIKTAEAEAESKKKVSDAEREADITVAENTVKVAEAEKDRDISKAEFRVLADQKKAVAEKAFDIALTEEEKTLKVKQAERDAAEKESQIKVQEKEAERKEQELVATIVKPAEAAKRKTIIDAEASKQQQILEAEAGKEVQIRKAEGEKQTKVLEGKGEAEKKKAIGDGEASATKATLTAAAEGAAAQKGLVLKAEAEGTKALAEALAKMTTDAKLILVLDRLPNLFDKGGEAMGHVMTSIFSSVAAPLGQIDSLKIIDVGGSGRGLEQISSIVPNVVFKFLAAAKVQGIDIREILSKFGINIDSLLEMIGETTPSSPQAKNAETTTV